MVIKNCVILREVALKENVHPEQVIAAGDGANDLEMLSSASLGITFNANVIHGNILPAVSLFPTLKYYYIF